MSVKARVVSLALAGLWLVGCDSIPTQIPQHEIPDMYPASGPVGLRTGFVYQRNFPSEHSMPYWDGGKYWQDDVGFSLELPIDVDPYWGGFIGIGYENVSGEKNAKYVHPDGTIDPVKLSRLNLIPIYIGLVRRFPGWLDEDLWKEQTAHVWIPNDPIGFAPYVRGAIGGAMSFENPDIVNRRTDAIPARTRALDYQIFPFIDGSVGLEYRMKSVGYWAELGYRLYIIPDRENAGFSGLDDSRVSDRMGRFGGIRAMIGMTWYLW